MSPRSTLALAVLSGAALAGAAVFLVARQPAAPPAAPPPPQAATAPTLSGSDLIASAAETPPTVGATDARQLALPSHPEGIRPLDPQGPEEALISSLVFDWVYYRDADGDWRTRIVQSWVRHPEEEQDGLVVVDLMLRPDLTWHDGHVADAEDLCGTVYALARLRDDRSPEQCIPVDERTARLRLTDLGADWRSRLAFPLVPAHVRGAADPAGGMPQEAWVRPVGTGPYQARVGRRGVVLEAAAAAHHGPRPERITFHVIEDPLVRLRTMATGELDAVFGVPVSLVGDARAEGFVLRDGGALGKVAWRDVARAVALSPDAPLADIGG